VQRDREDGGLEVAEVMCRATCARRGMCSVTWMRSFVRGVLQQVRTHLSLDKDAPVSRRRQTVGNITSIPILAGCVIYVFRYMFGLGFSVGTPLVPPVNV